LNLFHRSAGKLKEKKICKSKLRNILRNKLILSHLYIQSIATFFNFGSFSTIKIIILDELSEQMINKRFIQVHQMEYKSKKSLQPVMSKNLSGVPLKGDTGKILIS
jgi:hypothetical protein